MLIDLDADRMVSALRVPDSKLAKRALDSAAERVVTLRNLLGQDTPAIPAVQAALIDGLREGLGIDAEWGDISAEEERLAVRAFDEEIGTHEFLHEIDNAADDEGVLVGSHTSAGGTIDAYVKLEGPTREILQRALLTGDFFVTPPRFVLDLEAHLAGTRLDEIEDAVNTFFAQNQTDTLSVLPDDFVAAISAALAGPGDERL